jgi:hypothetical protein
VSSAGSLAEISAPILSYNAPLAPEGPKPMVKDEGTSCKKRPIAAPCVGTTARDTCRSASKFEIRRAAANVELSKDSQ